MTIFEPPPRLSIRSFCMTCKGELDYTSGFYTHKVAQTDGHQVEEVFLKF